MHGWGFAALLAGIAVSADFGEPGRARTVGVQIMESQRLLPGVTAQVQLFADMMVKSRKTISQILAGLEQRVGPHAYARHDIHLARDTYDTDRKRILETLERNEPQEVAGVPVQRVRSDDGFKFYLADGSWVLLRASGTEPLIRIYSEAADSEGVEARLRALEDIVGLRQHAGAS